MQTSALCKSIHSIEIFKIKSDSKQIFYRFKINNLKFVNGCSYFFNTLDKIFLYATSNYEMVWPT